jgi:hypothetical protein
MRIPGRGALATLAALALFTPTTLPAVPVDHDAPDGIAAIASELAADRGQVLGTTVLLGTDGALHVFANDGYEPYDPPYDLAFDWPVPFAEITDWYPQPWQLPDADDVFIHPGIVRTADGAHWVLVIEQKHGGWDSPDVPTFATRWERLPALPRE